MSTADIEDDVVAELTDAWFIGSGYSIPNGANMRHAVERDMRIIVAALRADAGLAARVIGSGSVK